MKLLYKLIFLCFTAIVLNAQTTMCYKENHKDMSTIENVKLDGGICQGQKTVKQMNQEGWETSDIKISDNNYIYLFKKVTNINNVNMDELEQRVLNRMKKEKEDKRLEERKKMVQSKIKHGKRYYENKCALCHGNYGESKKYNISPINTLSLDNLKVAIREYVTGERDNKPMAQLMVPYASMLNQNTINNLYVYMQSVKNNSKNKEKK